ncbi:MAG: hypothetical protein LBB53_04390 [Prevotellaceae bacterium]|jgi:hypothetical protein|nr:hypothetical protein [Prevotellaceae bacterium]
MTVYEAIHQMRLLSAKKEPFSFTFMSFSIEKQYSKGVVKVSKGYLTLRETTEQNKYAEYMLSYYDCNLQETRHFWQPLLMEFNGNQLELK